MNGASNVGYYLDEEKGWQVTVNELENVRKSLH
jgi:hypothetical protein